MSQQDSTYFEKKIEAKVLYDNHQVSIVFQSAKIKLRHELEIALLKRKNPACEKHFELTEDQLTITIFPPETYRFFYEMKNSSEEARWRMAYNLLVQIMNHSIHRLQFIVCPENLMFDQGYGVHFLHYGVRESIPPYETDEERVWQEAKATVASIVDHTYDFEMYIQHHETISLSEDVKQIMTSENDHELLQFIETKLNELERHNQTMVHLPKKRWKTARILVLITAFLLLPSLAYNGFAAFFKIPETEAYVESNNHFLQDKYSSVISTLADYEAEEMPYVVQYQLARSYIVNESLTEEQRINVENSVTLQSDENYFLYWILIGRGENEQAMDIARILEDRDLIIYGLLNYREEVKTDESLSGSEREEKLNEIQAEINEYEQEMEQEQSEEESQNEDKSGQTTQDTTEGQPKVDKSDNE